MYHWDCFFLCLVCCFLSLGALACHRRCRSRQWGAPRRRIRPTPVAPRRGWTRRRRGGAPAVGLGGGARRGCIRGDLSPPPPAREPAPRHPCRPDGWWRRRGCAIDRAQRARPLRKGAATGAPVVFPPPALLCASAGSHLTPDPRRRPPPQPPVCVPAAARPPVPRPRQCLASPVATVWRHAPQLQFGDPLATARPCPTARGVDFFAGPPAGLVPGSARRGHSAPRFSRRTCPCRGRPPPLGAFRARAARDPGVPRWRLVSCVCAVLYASSARQSPPPTTPRGPVGHAGGSRGESLPPPRPPGMWLAAGQRGLARAAATCRGRRRGRHARPTIPVAAARGGGQTGHRCHAAPPAGATRRADGSGRRPRAVAPPRSRGI